MATCKPYKWWHYIPMCLFGLFAVFLIVATSYVSISLFAEQVELERYINDRAAQQSVWHQRQGQRNLDTWNYFLDEVNKDNKEWKEYRENQAEERE